MQVALILLVSLFLLAAAAVVVLMAPAVMAVAQLELLQFLGMDMEVREELRLLEVRILVIQQPG